MYRIAVYGTLRRGFSNYGYFLSDQKFLGQQTINLPFKMISLGGFPGLIPTKEKNSIVIEVFEVDEEAMRGVDRLEGYPGWYHKAKISTDFGEAVIYFLDGEDYEERDVVPNGDWSTFKKVRYELFPEN